MNIAGRVVALNDALYHSSFQAFGTVIGFEGSSARLRIIGANGRERVLLVQEGGMVNGVRQVYWHEPIQLDLPRQNISKIQAVVDLLVEQYG
jgi:hypothetical protein